ncbi:hypothetical protein C8R46DRAFT_1191858 [Mycena filopes]|nr:hypothetical protein C8R46DRAFT_1191858 [Mycena filopes]
MYHWSDPGLGRGATRAPDDDFLDFANQAVFITGYRISLGRRWLNRFGPPMGVKLQPIETLPKGYNSDIPFPSPGGGTGGPVRRERERANNDGPNSNIRRQVTTTSNTSSASGSGNLGSHNVDWTQRGLSLYTDRGAPTQTPSVNVKHNAIVDSVKPDAVWHPSNVIHEYLLDAIPTARVIITHDDVWMSVMNTDDDTFPAPAVLLDRVLSVYDPVVTQQGAVVLKRNHRDAGEGLHQRMYNTKNVSMKW